MSHCNPPSHQVWARKLAIQSSECFVASFTLLSHHATAVLRFTPLRWTSMARSTTSCPFNAKCQGVEAHLQEVFVEGVCAGTYAGIKAHPLQVIDIQRVA